MSGASCSLRRYRNSYSLALFPAKIHKSQLTPHEYALSVRFVNHALHIMPVLGVRRAAEHCNCSNLRKRAPNGPRVGGLQPITPSALYGRCRSLQDDFPRQQPISLRSAAGCQRSATVQPFTRSAMSVAAAVCGGIVAGMDVTTGRRRTRRVHNGGRSVDCCTQQLPAANLLNYRPGLTPKTTAEGPVAYRFSQYCAGSAM